MNPDDPKFTAHALGEFDDLTPAERAEIEALLASDPAALAEAQETQALAARLRAELPGEQAAGLDEAQRAAVLAAVGASPKIVELKQRSWLLRSWIPRAIAAALVVACSVAALTGMRAYRDWESMLAGRWEGEPRLVEMNEFTALSILAGDALTGGSVGQAYRRHMDELSSRILTRPINDPPFAPFQLALESSARRQLALQRATETNFAGSGAARPTEGLVSVPEVALPPTETPRFALAQPTPVLGPTAPAQLAAITTTNVTASTDLSSFTANPAAGQPPLSPLAAPSAPASDLHARQQLSRDIADKISKFSAGWAKGGTSGFSRPTSVTSLDETALLAGLAPGEAGDAPEAVMREKLELAQHQPAPVDREAFDAITDNPFLAARDNPLSTFSIDVDTASYALVRRFLNSNQRPLKGAVRIEEMLNYFPYDYPQPQGDAPFSATMEVAACPWTPEHRLVRIGLKGREIAKDKRPASNLVFLIDVSGSMKPDNKLPLLKQSLALLIEQLGGEDQVAMVVYAGSSGTVLEPTRDKEKMLAALRQLEAGGSTNGASGLQLAYQLAEKAFIKGGTNRVILATDGDWNVGVTSQSDLLDVIAEKAKSGVFLTVLGLGMGNLNDSMMVKLAGRGNGNYAYLDTVAEARKVLVEQLSGTLVTIAKDVKIQVEFNPAQVGAYRLIGYEKRMLAKEDFNNDKKDAGEIGAGHTVTALYEVVPVGRQLLALEKRVDALKYQPAPAAPSVPLILTPERAPQDGNAELLPPHSPATPAPPVERAPQTARPYLLDETSAEAAKGIPAPAPRETPRVLAPAPSPGAPMPEPVAKDKTFGGVGADAAGIKAEKSDRVLAVARPPLGNLSAQVAGEMLTLKLRYKEPEGETSKLLEFPLTDSGVPWEQSSRDLRFAAAVAGYGMLLRDSAHKGQATWSAIAEWAQEGLGVDASGYRAEFLTLVEKARALTR